MCHNSYLSNTLFIFLFFTYVIPGYLAHPPAFTFFPSSVFQSWAVSSLCVSSCTAGTTKWHTENKKKKKSNCCCHVRAARDWKVVKRSPERSGFFFFCCWFFFSSPSCQTGLNTVFRIVTQRHTITVIDIQLCTSSLFIFSWHAAVCWCCSAMVDSHRVPLRMWCLK